ncbi:MAG: ATP synthase F1 subunit gamma [Candidatus Wildermuthbacteria bacterium]|nr:ATP synthase F1 subunit gamma [Candidatus Wildermuthbacteria bacterium]
MASKRQLRSKIQSVKNIKQITRAMQMVAATKMRKSQDVALGARPYAKNALALLSHIIQYKKNGDISFSSLEQPKESAKKVCLVVITSDKGLAGSFNGSVLRLSSNIFQELRGKGEAVDIVAVGKKGKDFFAKRGSAPVAEFLKFSDIVQIHAIAPLSQWILSAYEKGEYKKIIFCSMQFVSALVQKAETNEILPLNVEQLNKIVEGIIPKTGKYAELAKEQPASPADGSASNHAVDYIFEPSREQIAEELARDLVRMEIAHLIFESNASEHSARMVAMKNATDNAQNMQETLTLALNKARQAAITQEVAEISTAKEALTSE